MEGATLFPVAVIPICKAAMDCKDSGILGSIPGSEEEYL